MEAIHIFESAGLGRAPFRFVGVQTNDDRAVQQRAREANGQTFTTNYCTSCDFCSQAICNAFLVESADGKRFKVGCDCIKKTGDKGLLRVVKDEESRKRRAATAKRNKSKWERERELIATWRSGQCEALRSLPHPKGRDGATAWDYVDYCVSCGMYGATVLDLIESAVAS